MSGCAWLMSGCVVLRVRSSARCPAWPVPVCDPQHHADRSTWLDKSAAPPIAECPPAGRVPLVLEGAATMVLLGFDAHKRTHTVVAVDEHGRKLGERTVGTTTDEHVRLLVWEDPLRDAAAGGRWRTAGTCHGAWSGTCPALASRSSVSRPSSWQCPRRRPQLRQVGPDRRAGGGLCGAARARPANRLAGQRHPPGPAPGRHRDDLVAERTRVINRLCWHLHELDPPPSLPGPVVVTRQAPRRYRHGGRPLRRDRRSPRRSARAAPSGAQRAHPARGRAETPHRPCAPAFLAGR